MRKLIERLERHARTRAHRRPHPSRAPTDDRDRRHGAKFFTGHTPNPHERLTSEIRRSAGGPAADARWIVAEPPHRHATDGVAVGGRPTDASLTAIARRLAPHRCTKARITDAGALKKNGRSMSGHRIPAATTPDQ
ncbi:MULTISPECIES: hypothetical protein [Xanthomonas]|uniref:hypothetical protein n=1 Tax=Xanthomonas TaxID=338 RepID=UPI0012B60E6E|nr:MULTISPECIES: hypothetical protein [Xanthomonas]MBO9856707.1 hypothetical protein [Xanthomonas sp. A1809]MBV6789685.1 hypothetical protein [Xanthomonas campestris pv. clerodendri]MBV6886253.1 hypothetical protein [Xanthomonas campestris pv. spermacoces]